MSLAKRVLRLQERMRPSGGVTVMRRYYDEDDAAAEARWRRDNPGAEPADLRVILIDFFKPEGVA